MGTSYSKGSSCPLKIDLPPQNTHHIPGTIHPLLFSDSIDFVTISKLERQKKKTLTGKRANQGKLSIDLA
jgi:hypothetical protein